VNDWECLERAKRGEESAWRTLVERHHARLLGISLLITGSSSAAKDIAQESFVRLLDANVSHREGTVQGLLSTIAYRLALKEKARGQRTEDIAAINPANPSPSPLDELLAEERDRLVAAAIRSLDPQHRDILVLRFYGEHSYEEIAGLTGIPLGTVKSRIFYAVKSCQQFLRDKGLFA